MDIASKSKFVLLALLPSTLLLFYYNFGVNSWMKTLFGSKNDLNQELLSYRKKWRSNRRVDETVGESPYDDSDTNKGNHPIEGHWENYRKVVAQRLNFKRYNSLGDLMEDRLQFKKNLRNPQMKENDRFADGIERFRQTNSKVLLVIGVLSKLSDISRRTAMRSTWLSLCKQNPRKVLYKFFTDRFDEKNLKVNKVYLEERKKGDLVYMPYKGGFHFAQRLLWMFKYFTTRHKFDYFLRVDDDYFVCLQRLLFELPRRTTEALWWGWIHCEEFKVRIDEGFTILTLDLIEEILEKVNTTLKCSAMGDVSVAMWIDESRHKVTYFYDNDRLVHVLPEDEVQKFLFPDMCDKYLGLHQAYPEAMYKYWTSTQQGKGRGDYNVPEIEEFSHFCPFNKKLYWHQFEEPFYFLPKPCKEHPSWNDAPFFTREGRNS